MTPSIFSEKNLARLVESIVPPDRTNAIVGTVNEDGVAIVVKMHRGQHWTIEAEVRREWGGDVTGEAKVIWSW